MSTIRIEDEERPIEKEVRREANEEIVIDARTVKASETILKLYTETVHTIALMLIIKLNEYVDKTSNDTEKAFLRDIITNLSKAKSMGDLVREIRSMLLLSKYLPSVPVKKLLNEIDNVLKTFVLRITKLEEK